VAVAGGAGTYHLALASELPAAPPRAARWIGAGAGLGERGASALAGAELGLGPMLLSARGSYAFGRGFDAEALAGLGPGLDLAARAPEVQRDAVCLDDDCWARASRVRFREPLVTAARRVAILGGARVGRGGFSDLLRVSAVIAARWYHGRADRASFARDVVELGVTQLVRGRDRPFLRHASFIPGWYIRAERQWGVVFGAELGITGLARRDAEGRLEPELYARCHAYLPLDL
jgi:hypothetical protein